MCWKSIFFLSLSPLSHSITACSRSRSVSFFPSRILFLLETLSTRTVISTLFLSFFNVGLHQVPSPITWFLTAVHSSSKQLPKKNSRWQDGGFLCQRSLSQTHSPQWTFNLYTKEMTTTNVQTCIHAQCKNNTCWFQLPVPSLWSSWLRHISSLSTLEVIATSCLSRQWLLMPSDFSSHRTGRNDRKSERFNSWHK